MAIYRTRVTRLVVAFVTGAATGILGGLVGLGGAEFRLPVFLGAFGLPTLSAVVVNLVVSLVTVLSSLTFRAGVIPYDTLRNEMLTILNLLAGTIVGSYWGVTLATRLKEHAFRQIIAFLLFGIGILLIGHDVLLGESHALELEPLFRFALGILLGLGIGVVSSLLGVAGGELIIPTLILVFSISSKLAGSLSLVISAPTILLGLVRYHREGALVDLTPHISLVVLMALGSILGSYIGSLFLNQVSDQLLRWALALILFVSAVRILGERRAEVS